MKLLLSLTALALLCACGGNPHRQSVVEELSDECVQVLYFHGKQRCVTCNAIEQLTKQVVDSIASDKVIMQVVDITENEALADKYQVTWSSLLLDRDGKVENLTEMGFGYAKNRPEVFKTELTEAIGRISE